MPGKLLWGQCRGKVPETLERHTRKMLTPIEFGLPSKFTVWRPGQLDAIETILDTKERFVVICAPTGFGKSLVYEAAAKMSTLRAVVCTSTKGLQDQLCTDFGQLPKWIDIRGQSNYKCKLAPKLLMPEWTTVDIGPCHAGVSCELRSNGECEYYHRYGQARTADIINTNYALWMHDQFKQVKGDDLTSKRGVDLLVLDEAHDAVEQLAEFIATEISYKDTQKGKILWPQELKDEDLDGWRQWGRSQNKTLLERLEKAEQEVKYGRNEARFLREIQDWKRVQREVAKVAGMQGEWIVERVPENRWNGAQGPTTGPRVRFDPLWPKHYAESVLFRGAKKVVLVSATVRPKTVELLGIATRDSTFREFPSSFPVASRPVIHVPSVQMNYRNEQDDHAIMWWLNRIDAILDQRQDRRGVIHTVSYKRAQLILANSRHASRMLSHFSKDRAEVVQKFKSSTKSQPNAILLSPSVDTGYDFPYAECEFQIIAKIPFADNRGRVIKARMKADPQYSNYTTAQILVQMTGRGMRAEDDRCETLIVDDNAVWFIGQNREHFPKWFLDSVQYRIERPIPLPKL